MGETVLTVLATLAVVLLGLYAALLVGIVWVSAHPPRVPQFISPGFLGLPQENVEFLTADGLCLRGWFTLPAGDVPPRFVMIYVHGYLMNRCEPVGLAVRLARRGGAGLLFDLRAQGQSEGKRVGMGATEQQDVVAAIQWVQRRLPGVPIVLWGSSLGGAACALATAHLPPSTVQGLIVDSGFGRLTVAMRGWWPFFVGPFWARFVAPSNLLARWLLPVPPAEVDTAPAFELARGTPILLVYGDQDPIVPPTEVKRIHAAAGPAARLELFAGRGHSEARWHEPARYFALVEGWLDQVIPLGPGASDEDSARST